MGYKHHGVKTGGIPIEYIKRFVYAYEIPIFIETGTAGGESIRAAAPYFSHCHTIEIVEGRAEGEYPKNVTLHAGNSSEIIPSIVSKYKDYRIFFWLDAHWSEPYEAEEEAEECPLLKEINAIDHKKSIIMIDDARLFYGPPPWPCDPTKWPKLADVFFHLWNKFPEHTISIVDDYIVCIPHEMINTFRVEWRERYLERFPDDATKLRLSTKLAYENFMRYIG